jgi:phosphoribosyl 1,2-cyclic phosphodiesterase
LGGNQDRGVADGSDDTSFSVRFWGARGSIPVSGPEFRRYGGNTACVEVNCGGHILIFDAGSGIRPAGKNLIGSKVDKVHLFFTHFHYDHVIGLPFFKPLYDPTKSLEIWSGHMPGVMSTSQMLREFMRAPWFPVEISVCRAGLISRDFRARDVLRPAPGIAIHTRDLNHPGGCIGYRVEYGGRAVALVSDTEHVEGELDPNVLDLIENAELVIYDCAYTEAEMAIKRGFGHSTWQQGVKLCRAAGARKLAIFHHEPFRSDDELAAIEAQARKEFSGTFAARDEQVVDIPARTVRRR